jgi:hypothetical protein
VQKPALGESLTRLKWESRPIGSTIFLQAILGHGRHTVRQTGGEAYFMQSALKAVIAASFRAVRLNPRRSWVLEYVVYA